MPRISVAILSYNFSPYIGKCIESVLAQTVKPIEIIICDDCSTDNSWDIIKSYKNRYPDLFKIFRHEKNKGVIYNSQFWSQHVSGDFSSWMDGDDYWLPRKLEMEWKALEKNPQADIAFSNVLTVDKNNNPIEIWQNEKISPPTGDVFIDVYSRNFFSNSRSIFRSEFVTKKAFLEEGHQDDTLTSYWDWDRKIRYAYKYNVAYSGEMSSIYRIHPKGFSQSNYELHQKALTAIYYKYLPLLKTRCLLERVRVICSLEPFLAIGQQNLPEEKRNSSLSIDTVIDNVCDLYFSLTNEEREQLPPLVLTSIIRIIKSSALNCMQKRMSNLSMKESVA